jgi:hypothetical protein
VRELSAPGRFSRGPLCSSCLTVPSPMSTFPRLMIKVDGGSLAKRRRVAAVAATVTAGLAVFLWDGPVST